MNKNIQYLVGAASIVVIVAGLKLGADLINQILMAFLLAICITPLPEWLSRKGLSKGLSIVISMIVIIAGGFLITSLLANSVASLLESIPEYQERLTLIYEEFTEYALANQLDIYDLIHKINISPEKLMGIAQKVLTSLTEIISSSVIIAMLIVFIVIELTGYRVDTFRGKREVQIHMEWLGSMSGDLRKYVTITALKGLITAVGNYIFLIILGVDFAFLWAFFSFFMNFIPNFGFILSFLPPAVIALISLGAWPALVVFIGFWAINFVVENVLGPIFMKESLNISLLSTFLSLLVWGWILGLPGTILSIPLTLVVMKIYKDTRKDALIPESS